MTLALHRRATALAERAWDRCWSRVRRGQAPLERDRDRWERLVRLAHEAIEREQRETAQALGALAQERTR